jgi:hypothetical protein
MKVITVSLKFCGVKTLDVFLPMVKTDCLTNDLILSPEIHCNKSSVFVKRVHIVALHSLQFNYISSLIHLVIFAYF